MPRTLACLGGFPDLIEDSRSQCRLILREKATVVFRHHICGVLDGVARLLVGSGLFENVGRQDIADIVRAMR